MSVGTRTSPAKAGRHVQAYALIRVGSGFSQTFCALCAVALCSSQLLSAQRGRGGNTGQKPAVDVVQSVGCVERREGNPETWWITHAVEPKVSQPGVFSTTQVDAAKGSPSGDNSFQLVGVADFLDAEGLLRSGRRREFTTAQNANATGELRPGRKVLVKGMFITTGETKRINLLNVISLADSCS